VAEEEGWEEKIGGGGGQMGGEYRWQRRKDWKKGTLRGVGLKRCKYNFGFAFRFIHELY